MAQNLSQWLETLGIVHQGPVFHNLSRSELVAEAIRNGEGTLTHQGALGVITTPYTGRSPDDKFIVDYPDQTNLWWGDVNRRMPKDSFQSLQNRISAYLSNRPLYIVDCFIGA